MIRSFFLLLLLVLPVTFLGCSDGGPGGITDQQVHPAGWIATHPAPALAVAGFADCISCHAADLAGSGAVPSCFSCHAFNTEPPFIVHPADWVDPFLSHRGFAATNGFDTCTGCHGANLTGTAAAPSCFSASFDGRGCHAEGPGEVPHPLDGTYLLPANHGPDAKTDLTVCQSCHAELGGPGSNPRFNIGIEAVGGTGCEACHGINYAHPADWTTPPPAPHATAGNLQNACTLCHGVALDGVGGVGVSCLNCHGANPAANPVGCLSCHGQPPLAQAPVGDVSPNRTGQHNRLGHSTFIGAVPAETCARCHDGAGFGSANHFDLTNPADVAFTNPEPTDNVTVISDGINTTCNGNCHVNFNNADLIWTHTDATWY